MGESALFAAKILGVKVFPRSAKAYQNIVLFNKSIQFIKTWGAPALFKMRTKVIIKMRESEYGCGALSYGGQAKINFISISFQTISFPSLYGKVSAIDSWTSRVNTKLENFRGASFCVS